MSYDSIFVKGVGAEIWFRGISGSTKTNYVKQLHFKHEVY